MPADHDLKRHRRRIYRRTILILAFLFLLCINTAGLFAGTLFYNEFCVSNTRVGLERFNSLKNDLETGVRMHNWQEVSIQSRNGYTLQGTYLPNPIPTNKTILFLHGITGSRLVGLWYADIYQNEGYNVLLYDARAHGDSGGSSSSWGYYEKTDLDQWIDWLQQQHPGGIIGVHGVSMGAATALSHAEMNETTKKAAFYIADSAYSDLEDLLGQQIDATIPAGPIWTALLLHYSSAAAYVQSGFLYSYVSPVHSVTTATTPVLYLHGEADRLVPVSMCRKLYTATKGYREIHTFPGVGHGMAIFEAREDYQQAIHRFLHNATAKQPLPIAK
ncbi:MAG: hypothetical protein H6Q65_770 [Firmicutes bacterium]|nr:hypothetical protein [Bacillota bacterium]